MKKILLIGILVLVFLLYGSYVFCPGLNRGFIPDSQAGLIQLTSFREVEEKQFINDAEKLFGEVKGNLSKKDLELTPERIVEVEAAPSLFEQIKEHRVKRGENLTLIARKYNIDIDTLIGANDISSVNRINEGEILFILPVKGILYKINPGESIWTISRQFEIGMDSIIEANNIKNPELVKPGILLLLPGAKPELGYGDMIADSFIRPVGDQARISSYYGSRWGRMHEGIDFAVSTGTLVKASRSGMVIYSGWASGYGNTIVIEHQKGIRTLYAHNSRLVVHGGQQVGKGQLIAYSGNTGNSTGPHLHFEIQINGKPVDPMIYLQ
ncbi:MAG TPA: M23 family metallopeptidase [Halanaerobiales bacterium]|nr:M23 family metallopeptidase [Halanaerobiales bacterium]